MALSDTCSRSTTVSFLPACNDTCIAGEQLLGYLYSALYDAELREVRISALLLFCRRAVE